LSSFYTFRAMQPRSFYRFKLSPFFSGNAATLLLPSQAHFPFFGQCNGVPFTVLSSVPFFRAMHRLSFYRFKLIPLFSGNAAPLLLPSQAHSPFFRQCSRAPFTVLSSVPFFWAMQRLSFYRLKLISLFSGNAEDLLLPSQAHSPFFGQCSRAPFTVLGSAFLSLGNAAALLLPF
jgi:hypothetical protein